MERGTTKKNKRMLRSFGALVVAGGLALSACGSSGSTATGGDSDTTIAGDNAGSGAMGDWDLKLSSTPTMLASLDEAISEKKPIVVTLWKPHWAYSAYDLKDLKDPEGTMGKGEKIWLTANKEWATENPDLVAALEKFKMTDTQLSSLENQIFNLHKEDDNPGEAGAKAWLEKPENAKAAEEWAAGLEGDGDKVTIGMITWGEDVASTHLWKILLENHGYEVKIQETKVAPLFQAMAAGDVDLFFDTWLPKTHEDYWAKFGDKLTKISDWYKGLAKLTITVPTYMTDVNSMADLSKIADKVDSTIIGIEPGAGLSRVTQCAMMPTYNLAPKPTGETCTS